MKKLCDSTQALAAALLCFGSLVSLPGFAVTVSLSPADQIRLDSLVSECSEPARECPELPENRIEFIKYLQTGELDEWSRDNEPLPVEEEGLLVAYTTETSDQTQFRFFPLYKVELSSDDKYYMCPEGGEYQLVSQIDVSSLGLDPKQVSDVFQAGFQPTSFVCKSFWAPRRLFNELKIDKKKIGLPPGDEDPIDWPWPNPGDSYTQPGASPIEVILRGSPSLIVGYWWVPGGRTRPPRGSDPPIFIDPDDPAPPPPVITPTPVPVGGECGLFPWRCAYEAIADYLRELRD